jgi:hypothetical protein
MPDGASGMSVSAYFFLLPLLLLAERLRFSPSSTPLDRLRESLR